MRELRHKGIKILSTLHSLFWVRTRTWGSWHPGWWSWIQERSWIWPELWWVSRINKFGRTQGTEARTRCIYLVWRTGEESYSDHEGPWACTQEEVWEWEEAGQGDSIQCHSVCTGEPKPQACNPGAALPGGERARGCETSFLLSQKSRD